jgi:fibro-slime domain-containing protein
MKRKNTGTFRKLFIMLLCLTLFVSSADIYRPAAYSSAALSSDSDTDTVNAGSEAIVCKNEDGSFTAATDSEGIKVTAAFTEEAEIPEGAVLTVNEIVTDTPQYDEYFEESSSALNDTLPENSDSVIELRHARFFDISFIYKDEEIEPKSAVSVEMTYDRPDLDYESYDIVSDVIHFSEDQAVLMEASGTQDIVTYSEEAEALDTPAAPSDIMRFETDSFSAYGILFYNVSDNNIGDMLDGMSFALLKMEATQSATTQQNGVPAVLASYLQTSRLALKEVTVYPRSEVESENEFSHYAITDSDITEWTFTWIEGNNYYVTAQVDGVTKYLSVYSERVSDGGKVELLDTPDEYSVITVKTNGTGNNADKIRLVNKDGWALNKKGNNKGFQSYLADNGNEQDKNEWLVPAVHTDAELKNNVVTPTDDIIIHTANKVSVSDTVDLCDGAEVVVYSKVWDHVANEYVNYAIDGNGKLVKVWESGNVVQWKDDEDTSLYWQFIQYGDTGYYEFYNPVTGMYLAPQNGQILSNDTIGVTLTGRGNGEYTSQITAWDENVWSWYGYDYSDRLALTPVVETQAAEMCFAVKYLNDGNLHQVETVDSKAAGITTKMYDYVNASNQNSIMGESTFTGEGKGARKNLVEKILDGGYPVATQTGSSLEPLFTANSTYPEREVNHLFIKNTYDETGYFEYSCFDTSAFLMQENGNGASPSAEGYAGVYDFGVYQELVSPGKNLNKRSYCRGNFLPFDMVDNHDVTTKNLYDSISNPISSDDPRYNEAVYVQSSPDHYFGMSLDATFMIPEKGRDENGNPLIFEFTGDDDFWLFIDDVLVLDLGGIHNALTGKVNFTTGEVATYNGYIANTYSYTSLKDCFRNAGVFPDGSPWDDSLADNYFKDDGSFQSGEGVFKDYSSHTMKIFYMERGAGASNLKLRFNLATVDEKSVFLEKQLTGTHTTDYSNTKYAYQLYYKPEGSSDFVLYANPDDESQKVHYEGQNSLVEYDESTEINGTAYQNVFYLRAGENAEFTMPSKDTEYYFKELSVFNQEYDYVNINNERAFTSDFAETRLKEYPDVGSATDTVTNRKRVVYENHIDQDYLKKLIITKNVVDKDGNHVENDKTGFEFQVGFLNDAGETVPYQKKEYYVTDADGNYYVYVNGKLSKHGKEKAVCSVSGNNGSIAGIPDGFSVVIEELIPQTVFKVEELPEKMPLGYELKSYERNTDSEGATYNLVESGVYNIGEIRENTNAHMIVNNQKGFGITVNKSWSDEEYTSSHATIYIALFHKEAGGGLTYVENTCRELVYPNTSVYYFNDEQEASEYAAMEVIPGSIQPADWGGDTAAVTDCQPYAANSTTRLNAETFGGEAYDFDYKIGYQQGEIGGTGHNIRTDTITNSRDFLEILKQTMDGKALSGAVFTITDVTDGAVLDRELTSDEEGFVTRAYFTAGHSYRLDEIQPPNGYAMLAAPVMIYVDENERLDIQYSADDADNIALTLSADEKSGTLIIKDEQNGMVLRKTDDNGVPLSGAVFSLYQFDRAFNRKYPLTDHQNTVSDENGVFFSGSLNSGYYLIEEIKAPSGYASPEESVVVHLRTGDNMVDQIYTVKYDSESGRYVTVRDVTDQWLAENGNIARVDIPNEKLTGSLKIRKTIDRVIAARGCPTFMFRVTQTKDENGNTIRSGPEYIRAISFELNDSRTKEVLLSGLPIGTYRIEELSALNYEASELTVEGDSRPVISSNTSASVTLASADPVTVAFNNHFKGTTPVSDTAFADNRISYTASQDDED